MYYYVELMRAKRAMRVVGIILGLIVVAAIVLRISIINHPTPSQLAANIEHSPTAHVSRATLADGTVESTVDDPPRNLHAVIDRRGNQLNIDLTAGSEVYHSLTAHGTDFGSSREHVSEDKGVVHGKLSYTTDVNFSFSGLFLVSMVMGLIAATLLAAPLAKENDGHLDITWTKPVTREAYALSSVLVDFAAIIASQVVTVLVLLLCSLMFVAPSLTLGSLAVIAVTITGPLAWHSLLTAASAGIKRGPGLVVGLGWLAAFIIPSIAEATRHLDSAVGVAIHKVFQAVAYLDPIAYLTFSNDHFTGNGAIQGSGATLAVMCVLTVLYILSAVLVWRRVEA